MAPNSATALHKSIKPPPGNKSSLHHTTKK
jgi:hypothetical protein